MTLDDEDYLSRAREKVRITAALMTCEGLPATVAEVAEDAGLTVREARDLLARMTAEGDVREHIRSVGKRSQTLYTITEQGKNKETTDMPYADGRETWQEKQEREQRESEERAAANARDIAESFAADAERAEYNRSAREEGEAQKAKEAKEENERRRHFRAMQAYLAAGGAEEGFETFYASAREQIIRDETLLAMRGHGEQGSTKYAFQTSDDVRW